MTKPEIERKERELRFKYYENGCMANKPLREKTKRDKILEKKLSIAEMMISNLVYGGDYFKMTGESWYVRNTKKFDWEVLEELGVKDGKAYIKRLWKEMKRDFAEHCRVVRNAYTDSEGCTYNATEWF